MSDYDHRSSNRFFHALHGAVLWASDDDDGWFLDGKPQVIARRGKNQSRMCGHPIESSLITCENCVRIKGNHGWEGKELIDMGQVERSSVNKNIGTIIIIANNCHISKTHLFFRRSRSFYSAGFLSCIDSIWTGHR